MPQVSPKQQICTRVRVVPHLSSGIVERAKRERAWKSPHARKGDMRRGERKMRDYRQSPSYWPFTANQSFALWEQRISSKAWALSVVTHFSLSPPRLDFLAWGDFHARSRFARSAIPEEKWGTTRSLNLYHYFWNSIDARNFLVLYKDSK